MLHSDLVAEFQEMLAQPSDVAWQRVLQFWAKCDHVYSGPAGPDGFIAPAYDLAQLIPANLPNAEQYLVSGLTNDNPIVAAYSLVSLFNLYNESGRFLPRKYAEMVQNRHEAINHTFGCFGSTTTIAKLVLKYIDNYQVES